MERVSVEAAPMSRHSGAPEFDAQVTAIGREAYELIEKLFPFCRSLTGEGVRRTLRALQSVDESLKGAHIDLAAAWTNDFARKANAKKA